MELAMTEEDDTSAGENAEDARDTARDGFLGRRS
jgi:hypothetical protein